MKKSKLTELINSLNKGEIRNLKAHISRAAEDEAEQMVGASTLPDGFFPFLYVSSHFARWILSIFLVYRPFRTFFVFFCLMDYIHFFGVSSF